MRTLAIDGKSVRVTVGYRGKYVEAVRDTGKRDVKGSIIWECKCHYCGNTGFEVISSNVKIQEGCSKCKYERRLYRDVERACIICDTRFTCKDNTRTNTCSPTCKASFLAQKTRNRTLNSLENVVVAKVAQSNSRRKHREGSFLNPEIVLEECERLGWACSKTGIPFEKQGAFSPSIDRIDSCLPYTHDNIQIVCWIYNRCKQVDSDEDVLLFAKQLVIKQGIFNEY